MGVSAEQLRTLADRPFELLLELERLTRAAIADQTEEAVEQEWVGIGFRLSGERFLIDRRQVREVMTYPGKITRVPGSKRWVAGLASVRGQLVPVYDLKAFLGGGVSVPDRATRILVANNRDVPAALIVDEVLGFRRFASKEYTGEWAPTILRCDRYMAGAYRRSSEVWPVFDLQALLEHAQFQNVEA
jgi:twitching motility protein PilI